MKKGKQLAIAEIKASTLFIKHQLKNLRYKHRILKGETPSCSYGCKYATYLKTLHPHDLKYTENNNLLLEIYRLNELLRNVGKTIIFLRGGKWSF